MDEENIQVLAEELIKLKMQIKQLQDREKILKEEIKPFLKEYGVVKLEFGRIYYSETKGAKTFNRRKVLDYIRDNYGDNFANRIDQECTTQHKPLEIVYVRLKNL